MIYWSYQLTMARQVNTFMLTLGIDIGSTTSKCVLLRDGGEIVASSMVSAGIGTSGSGRAIAEVLETAGVTMDDVHASAVTGYGRNSYTAAQYQASELTCHALGARIVFPQVRTIIDIGGQDAKIICLNHAGIMQSFLMNDKCAAGTGRFLDVMAGILQMPVSQLETEAAQAVQTLPISSTCTVFAESEVISQLSGGASIPDVVAGICESVAVRTASLAKRQPLTAPLCMSGGVAHNKAVRDALARQLGMEILYDDKAQLFGALGAARLAYQKSK